eukprot:SAG11_NODE_20383_length_446_cov_1.305476_1_plen_70_part_00
MVQGTKSESDRIVFFLGENTEFCTKFSTKFIFLIKIVLGLLNLVPWVLNLVQLYVYRGTKFSTGVYLPW